MNITYRYEVRVRGIDSRNDQTEPGVISCRFSIGDRVWMRDPSRRCIVKSSPGTVTQVLSAQTVEVDGMPRHVRDLRHHTESSANQAAPAPHCQPDDGPLLISVQRNGRNNDGEESGEDNLEASENGRDENPENPRSRSDTEQGEGAEVELDVEHCAEEAPPAEGGRSQDVSGEVATESEPAGSEGETPLLPSTGAVLRRSTGRSVIWACTLDGVPEITYGLARQDVFC